MNRSTNAVHWIDLYPLDSAVGVLNIYMLYFLSIDSAIQRLNTF